MFEPVIHEVSSSQNERRNIYFKEIVSYIIGLSPKMKIEEKKLSGILFLADMNSIKKTGESLTKAKWFKSDSKEILSYEIGVSIMNGLPDILLCGIYDKKNARYSSFVGISSIKENFLILTEEQKEILSSTYEKYKDFSLKGIMSECYSFCKDRCKNIPEYAPMHLESVFSDISTKTDLERVC